MSEGHTDAVSRRRMLKAGALVGGAVVTASGAIVLTPNEGFGYGSDPTVYSQIDVKGGDERAWGVSSMDDPYDIVESHRVQRDVPVEWIEEHGGRIPESLPMPDPESFLVEFKIDTEPLSETVGAVKPAVYGDEASVQKATPKKVEWIVQANTGPWTAEVLTRNITLDNIAEAISTLSRDPLSKEIAQFTFDVGEINE